jgi:hypothetical protein
MSQDSDWHFHVWVGGLAIALMGSAAILGGSAWDWLERARGPVVAIQEWQGLTVPPPVEALMRQDDPG